MRLGLVSAKFCLGALGVFTVLLLSSAPARAQITYAQAESGNVFRYNLSETDETEDNWITNAYTVVAGGTRLNSITLAVAETYTNRPVTLAIYSGSSLTDPTTTVRIATTDTTFSSPPVLVTIPLDTPVDLNEGDIFFAAVLLRAVPGTEFPFLIATGAPSGSSFFDVGPAQGAPKDLDDNTNATLNGGIHPVVGSTAVDVAGNWILRVDATATP
jgi:hypothetical protein